MNDMAQFVSDLNVTRLLDKLRVERNLVLRASLRRLLLEEADKSGFNLERLSRVRRHIADGRDRIARQRALIERLATNGHDVRLAENTLHNLVEIQEILEQYRLTILNAIDRNRAMNLHEPSARAPYAQCHDDGDR
jgi:hypothetical protein